MSTTKKNDEQDNNIPKAFPEKNNSERPVCGLIMPIAGNDEYSASH